MAMPGGQEERNGANQHAHAEDAEKRMLLAIPTAFSDETVADVRKRVLNPRRKWDSVNYAYVIGKRGELRGVISIKELITMPARSTMRAFHRKDMAVVHRHSPLRLAAARAVAHNIKAVPVVDKERKFLGVIGADTVLEVLEREHVRDVLLASGLPAEGRRFADILSSRLFKMVEWRTPWLIAGVFGGMLTAGIVERFHTNIEQAIELAFFIPMMVYMGAAVGTQTQMLFVRGVSNQQVDMRRYVLREIAVDIIIATIISVILGAFALLTTGSETIARIVVFSSFAIVSTAGALAIAISSLLLHFKRDPAIGGGPFTTIVQDIVSLTIYLSIAAALLA